MKDNTRLIIFVSASLAYLASDFFLGHNQSPLNDLDGMTDTPVIVRHYPAGALSLLARNAEETLKISAAASLPKPEKTSSPENEK